MECIRKYARLRLRGPDKVANATNQIFLLEISRLERLQSPFRKGETQRLLWPWGLRSRISGYRSVRVMRSEASRAIPLRMSWGWISRRQCAGLDAKRNKNFLQNSDAPDSATPP